MKFSGNIEECFLEEDKQISFGGHLAWINVLILLPGRLLASGSDDTTIRIWNICDQALFKTLHGHTGAILSLAKLKNNFLASGSSDTTIKIWNPFDGILVSTLYGHTGKINSMVVLENGHLVSASDDYSIKIWDTLHKCSIETIQENFVKSFVILLLDQRYLAIGTADYLIKLWDLLNKNITQTLHGHTGAILSLAKLKNNFLASGSSDTTIKIWNPFDGILISTLYGHTGNIRSMSVLENGHLVSASDDYSIKIWDTSNESVINSLTESNGFIRTLLILTDKYLIGALENNQLKLFKVERYKNENILKKQTNHVLTVLTYVFNGFLACGTQTGSILIWKLDEGTFIKTLNGHREKIISLLYLKTGYLASSSENIDIIIWDLKEYKIAKVLRGHLGKVNSLVELANGHLASASDDKTIKIWNPLNGSLKFTLIEHTGPVNQLTVLPNGNLASASDDFLIILWNLHNGSVDKIIETNHKIKLMTCLPNGFLATITSFQKGIDIRNISDGTILKEFKQNYKLFNILLSLTYDILAVVSYDGNIIIWNTKTDDYRILRRNSQSIISLTYISNNYIASLIEDGSIMLWNWNSGIEVYNVNSNMDYSVTVLEVLSNQHIATVHYKTIQIWNLVDKKLEKSLIGHSDYINCLKKLKNDYLASGSSDNTIKIWNPYDGILISTLYGHTGKINSMVVLENGHLISTANDNSIKIWDNSTIVKSIFDNCFMMSVLPNDCLACSHFSELHFWNLKIFKKHVIKAHNKSIQTILALKDGLLVSVSEDKTIKLWNPYQNKLIKTADWNYETACQLALLPNGNFITWCKHKIDFWNNVSFTVLFSISEGFLSALAVLSNGKLVTYSSNKYLQLWDAYDNPVGGKFINKDENSNKRIKKIIKYLPNGNLALTSDRVVQITSSFDGTIVRKLVNTADISSLAFLSSFRLACGLTNFHIIIWDLKEYKIANVLRGHLGKVNSLVELANGHLASASDDKTIKIWNPLNASLIFTLIGHTAPVYHLGVLPDGNLISISDYEYLIAWDLSKQIVLSNTFFSYPMGLLTVSNHFIIISDYKKIDIWANLNSIFKRIKTLYISTESISSITTLYGNMIAAGTVDGKILYFDLDTFALVRTIYTYSGSINSLILANNLYLVSLSDEKYIKIWNLWETAKMLDLEHDKITSLVALINGR